MHKIFTIAVKTQKAFCSRGNLLICGIFLISNCQELVTGKLFTEKATISARENNCGKCNSWHPLKWTREKRCGIRPAFYRRRNRRNTGKPRRLLKYSSRMMKRGRSKTKDIVEKYVMTDEHRDKREQRLCAIVHPGSLLPPYVKTVKGSFTRRERI